MLRQLARLTRPVTAVPGALAIAVYADPDGRLIPAAERGAEGVACVDDAGRALALLCDLWTATRLPFLRAWAEGLLGLVLHMQDSDGCFVNFISDWDGTRNVDGPTSCALGGGTFWHARAVRGLASAALVFDDQRIAPALARGIAHFRTARDIPANVRALHVLTAVLLLRAGRMPEIAGDLAAWCEELAECRHDGVLFDDPDQSAPHLWAHLQEGALTDGASYVGRADLVAVARASAVRYLAPLIASGFDLPTVQPDGVASALFGVERLAAVTGEHQFEVLSDQARAWFDGRNSAGWAVYDRRSGRVHDGIDDGVLNAHSGAESNIAAAQALFAEVAREVAGQRIALESLLPAANVAA
ncbi:MAG: hypothetical protein HYX56_03895 [Chloroflexi bacterium]|nr:hypothetical protein [Chloroflexota bacterium]